MVSRKIRPGPSQNDLCPGSYASYSEVESAGTAARPLEFPSPSVRRGHRIAAHAIDPRTGRICHVKNIIVRDRDDRSGIPSIPTRGYRIVKKLSDSTYGSVNLCVVMKRRHIFYGEFASQHHQSKSPRNLDSISEDDEFSTSSSSEDAMNRHSIVKDNIVWEPTEEYVAVKVSILKAYLDISQLIDANLFDAHSLCPSSSLCSSTDNFVRKSQQISWSSSRRPHQRNCSS